MDIGGLNIFAVDNEGNRRFSGETSVPDVEPALWLLGDSYPL